MIIEDFSGSFEVEDVVEVERILTRRYAGCYNGFWLFHESKFPSLSILVKDEVAYAHYFPKERHAGFRSKGHEPNLNGDTTEFRLDNTNQKEEIENSAVISFADELSVAKDFFYSSEIPRVIEWIEL